MSERTAAAAMIEVDEDYVGLETAIASRVAGIGWPMFETDAAGLWEAYLGELPVARRQHYNCYACKMFIERYGGLVTIADDGNTIPVLWSIVPPPFFAASVAALARRVERSKVTGVFCDSSPVWGVPQTGGWSHLSATPANVFKTTATKTAHQAAAAKREEYGMLCHALSDYGFEVAAQALRVLKADAVYRSEKALGVAEWFVGLHTVIRDIRGPRRNNIIWRAVADAPPGFCHVRSTIISTLLDDIAAGMDFATIARRWADKTHPLQYQRPSAPPSVGNIEQAERLVEKLGVAKSLERRFARLDEVQVKLWTPKEEETKAPGGVFDHLRNAKQVQSISLPPVLMTWEKFARDILPEATGIEVSVPLRGGFYGLVTAADADAPPILQWDGLSGHPRNPVSWYFYHGGSSASQWHLDGWAKVTAIFPSPPMWHEPTKFVHHGETVMFALEGCWDANGDKCGLALFPETLKSEFHGIRSVIEAHSRAGGIREPQLGTANGLAFQKGHSERLTLRVKSAGGVASYTLDRWE